MIVFNYIRAYARNYTLIKSNDAERSNCGLNKFPHPPRRIQYNNQTM